MVAKASGEFFEGCKTSQVGIGSASVLKWRVLPEFPDGGCLEFSLHGNRDGFACGTQAAMALGGKASLYTGLAMLVLISRIRRFFRVFVADPGVGQIADHAVAGDEAAPGASPGQPHNCRGDRPDTAGPADHRHLRALRLPRAGAGSHQPGPASSAHHRRGPVRS